MCRTAVLALTFCAALGAAAAEAQGVRSGTARTRALVARAESLQAALARQDSIAKLQRYDDLRARRFDAGNVIVILPTVVGAVTGQRIASGAKRYLDSLGAVPASFIAARVAIAYPTAGWDSVLRAEGLGGRARLMVDIPAKPDSFEDGWIVAAVFTRAYAQTLDPEWRSWVSEDLGLGFMKGRDDVAAVRELAAGDTHSGVECLGGRPAGCRRWLGLDREADSNSTRYSPAEIRALVSRRLFEYLGSVAKQCVNGSDDACLRFARSGGVSPVPAGTATTRSVLRALRVLHGADALQRALADTSGAIGQRLARAAGVGEDSLVTEWRSWLLTGGERPHITAGARDALPVLLFGGVLLLGAATSGRWR